MADFTISLTSDEIEALEVLWDIDTLTAQIIENTLKTLAENKIRDRVNEEWNKKNLDDKKTLLGEDFSIKPE